MSYLVRIGRIDTNKCGVGSRGYFIKRQGKTVILRWAKSMFSAAKFAGAVMDRAKTGIGSRKCGTRQFPQHTNSHFGKSELFVEPVQKSAGITLFQPVQGYI